MIAFDPNGPLLSVVSPAGTQVVSGDNVNNNMAMVTNIDTTNDAIIGWGSNPAAAQLAATSSSTNINSFYLLHSSQVPLVIPTGSFVFIVPVSGTPTVKIQAGISLR